MRAATQAAIAQPTRRGAAAPPRLEALAQGARHRARRPERGDERPRGAGQRVRAALDARRRAQQPRDEQRVRGRARRGERAERAVEQLAIGVEEHGHVVRGVLEAGVVRRPEPEVSFEHDRLRPVRAGDRGALVARAAVDDDDLRRRAEVALDRGQQRREVARRVVDDDDDGEAHRARPRRGRRASRAPTAPSRSARRPARRGGQARRAAPRRSRRAGAPRPAPSASPGATRSAPSPSVSANTGRSLTTLGVPSAAASTGGRPKPSSHEGSDDRDRTGVERGEFAVVAERGHAADAGAGDRHPAVADDDEVGLEPALAGPRVAGREDVRRLARLERADEQQVRRAAVDRRARPRALGPVEQRPGRDDRRVHAPGPRDVRPHRVRVAHDGGGAARRARAGGRARCHARS